MDEHQVEHVEVHPAQAVLDRADREVAGVEPPGDLGLDEDFGAGHGTLPDGPADLGLVLVVDRRVEKSVADVQGRAHRSHGVITAQRPGAEADGGELEAVVERASGDRGGGHGVHCGDPLARWVRAL